MEWIVKNVLEVGLSHVAAMANAWSVCLELCLLLHVIIVMIML